MQGQFIIRWPPQVPYCCLRCAINRGCGLPSQLASLGQPPWLLSTARVPAVALCHCTRTADEARGGTSTRAAAVEGGFKKVLSFLRINGKDAMPQVEGDQTFQLASDTVVFLPAAKHAHDPISGPIAIIRTPDFQVGLNNCWCRVHGMAGGVETCI